MSIYEIYNEIIRDLLQPNHTGTQSTHNSQSVSETIIHTKEELHALVQNATQHRATAGTKMNDRSSRSHMVVTFILYSQAGERKAKLTLVDLAGSEDLNKSQAENERQKEAIKINVSLFELTNVLQDLSKQKPVATYRNSKLTWMLKVSLSIR